MAFISLVSARWDNVSRQTDEADRRRVLRLRECNRQLFVRVISQRFQKRSRKRGEVLDASSASESKNGCAG